MATGWSFKSSLKQFRQPGEICSESAQGSSGSFGGLTHVFQGSTSGVILSHVLFTRLRASPQPLAFVVFVLFLSRASNSQSSQLRGFASFVRAICSVGVCVLVAFGSVRFFSCTCACVCLWLFYFYLISCRSRFSEPRARLAPRVF